MAEVRIDPLSGLRVIVAPEDPVLAGVEHPGADPLESGRGDPDLFAVRPASGAHEVIGPADPLESLEPAQVESAAGGWRERMRAHPDAAYLHMAVDQAGGAGRAQLFALPFVPALVARERERFTAYALRTNGRNLLEDLVQEEVRLRERVVAIDDQAVAFCPFASRTPFQVTIAPRKPRARFEDDGPLGARLLHDVLGRLAAVAGPEPALSLWIRTAPRDAEHFCWRIDVLPAVAASGGLEPGTGV
ncbi:MAG: UDPglucose--hexose-phosphate uridylyltransferase, partial [Thermoleophilaceae bacterium]|nr:UDPglucose--hexose-phosphate uridylyltransferase [Thermoleophilaceae bacterium]